LTRLPLRAEFLSDRTAFTDLKVAQQALDEWVEDGEMLRFGSATIWSRPPPGPGAAR
jgi:hypothetical protein